MNKLHRHLTLHLGIESPPHVSLRDIPHLLAGHYIAETLIHTPFHCSFSLAPLMHEQNNQEPETETEIAQLAIEHPESRGATPVIQVPDRPPRYQTPRPMEESVSLGLLQTVHPVSYSHGTTPPTVTVTYQRPAAPVTAVAQVEDTGTSHTTGVPDSNTSPTSYDPRYKEVEIITTETITLGDTDSNKSHSPLSSNVINYEKLASDIKAKIQAIRNQTNTIMTDQQIDELLETSSDDSTSQIVFNVLPPDDNIEKQVQNKLLKRRRKINSSAKNLKKLKVITAPVLPSYDRELAMQNIYHLLSATSEIDATDLLTLLKTVGNAPGTVAAEIHDRSQNEITTEAEKDFLFKHRAHYLYHLLQERLIKKFENMTVLPTNLVHEELEQYSPDLAAVGMCNDCKTPHTSLQYCMDLASGGPNIAICQTGPIPSRLITSNSIVMFAMTPALKHLDKYLDAMTLNLSPSLLSFSTGPLPYSLRTTDGNYSVPSANTLYHELVTLLARLGQECTLPIFIEFRPKAGLAGFSKRIPEECDYFIRTLALIQKQYKGLIIGIAPIPYWLVGSDVRSYQFLKSIAFKAACYLTGFGLAAGIYVVHCDIGTLPTGGPIKHYTWNRKFKRNFIFDLQGKLVREGKRRLNLELSREVDVITSLPH
jgi:hypothetical protein